MDVPSVSSHVAGCENCRTKCRFIAVKIIEVNMTKWRIFQLTMFDYQWGCSQLI